MWVYTVDRIDARVSAHLTRRDLCLCSVHASPDSGDKKSFLDAVTETNNTTQQAKEAESCGATKEEDGRVYLDQIQKKKDDLSPAMKEKLRREYYSLGGAPDKAATNSFLYIIVFISLLSISLKMVGIL